ncbi:chlorophyllase/cutinase-like alpha/beta fold protein [Phenylobacterium sp.]|uniref:poly(ethylene terephthalate) hydrolase family protein n=1 Tax=Phenylobacterium sp. TaxID=1871053 RepID=UPI002F406B0E
MRRTFSKAWTWLKPARSWLTGALTPSPVAWSAATYALLALWAAILVSFLIYEVFLPFSFEKLLGLIVIFAAFALLSLGVLLVVGILSLLKLRYRFALLLALPLTLFFLLIVWSPEGMGVGAPLLLIGLSLAAGSTAALLSRRQRQGRAYGALIFLSLGLAALGVLVFGLVQPLKEPNPWLVNYRLAGTPLDLPDPGKPGPYKVRYLTYGGGSDRYRPEFAAKASFRSRPVDGSKLDAEWRGLGGAVRSFYWGFGPKAFPVQGRVWAPTGSGPFPLVLIVHGNHNMERFSDPGYAYLGELLASQGFIAVSVDENFLNSSLADLVNPLKRRGGEENDARAWLLLEHLVQWRGWNADPTNPLHGEVDMDRIGLIGHSRGGEAVGIAAAFNQLDRYPDDASQVFNYHFKLGAVAAIAPVDGQYKPRHRSTPLSDVNYFTIQGSIDGDERTFGGASQYSRDLLTGKVPAFKASLYVKDADHNQFNTTWGRNDLGLPWEFLLDERTLLKPADQRQIAKVYLSAFLQETLMGKTGYRPLFEDPRRGAAWLPPGYLAANYADGATAWAATYDEDLDPSTAASPGARITGDNLSVWREDDVKLKSNPLDTQVALIGWDDRVHKAHASYGIELGEAAAKAGPGADLVFSLAAAGIDSLPKDFHPSKAARSDKAKEKKPDKTPLDWSVVLVDARGMEARLPLSHDQLLYPQIVGYSRRFAALDGAEPSEVVMRRYRLPLNDFVAQNPAIDLAHLHAVRFDFDRSPRGTIALDDVGIAPVRR